MIIKYAMSLESRGGFGVLLSEIRALETQLFSPST